MSRKKTTTFRLGNSNQYKEGDEVMLSIGWKVDEAIDLHPAKINKSYGRRINQLNESDLEGESPDCQTPEATKLVLSSIYRTVLRNEDEIWVLKYEHK